MGFDVMGSDLRQVLNTFVTDISMLPQIVVALTVLFLVFKLVRDNNAVWDIVGWKHAWLSRLTFSNHRRRYQAQPIRLYP
jgi:hypothetical protein